MSWAVSITPGNSYTTYAVVVATQGDAIAKQNEELAKDPSAKVQIMEVKDDGDK